jgi:stage V sporulation protein B
MEFVKQVKEVRGLFGKLKRRDFSGNSGQAIKNSFYSTLLTIVNRIGSLIFALFLARWLTPEIYGNYGIILSTVLLFEGFSSLGLGSALIKYTSSFLNKKNYSKANLYLNYIYRFKISLSLFISFLLIISAKFIAENYYHKPLFYGLVISSVYLFFLSVSTFLDSLFQALNDFKFLVYKEFFFQSIRFLLIFILASFFAKNMLLLSFDNIFWIFILLGFSYFLTYILSIFILKKNYSQVKLLNNIFLKKEERKEVNLFILSISIASLSGTLFAHVDTLMIGRFLFSEFVAYYNVAFTIVASLSALITFSLVLFPIFSRLEGKRLEKGFSKSARLTFCISLLLLIFCLIFSPFLLWIFGKEYLVATNLLRIFSLLMVSFPMIALYSSYFVSRGKPAVVTKFLIISTIVNIVLNYILITSFLQYSQMYATMGAVIATVISRYFYLAVLILERRKLLKG